jgi:hypothetical protein
VLAIQFSYASSVAADHTKSPLPNQHLFPPLELYVLLDSLQGCVLADHSFRLLQVGSYLLQLEMTTSQVLCQQVTASLYLGNAASASPDNLKASSFTHVVVRVWRFKGRR